MQAAYTRKSSKGRLMPHTPAVPFQLDTQAANYKQPTDLRVARRVSCRCPPCNGHPFAAHSSSSTHAGPTLRPQHGICRGGGKSPSFGAVAFAAAATPCTGTSLCACLSSDAQHHPRIPPSLRARQPVPEDINVWIVLRQMQK